MLHEIKITSPDGNGRNTNIEIDGEPCRTLSAVKFEVTADNFAVVDIRAIAQQFEYDGKAVIKVDDQTAELLISLGWTPPA